MCDFKHLTTVKWYYSLPNYLFQISCFVRKNILTAIVIVALF